MVIFLNEFFVVSCGLRGKWPMNILKQMKRIVLVNLWFQNICPNITPSDWKAYSHYHKWYVAGQNCTFSWPPQVYWNLGHRMYTLYAIHSKTGIYCNRQTYWSCRNCLTLLLLASVLLKLTSSPDYFQVKGDFIKRLSSMPLSVHGCDTSRESKQGNSSCYRF